MGLGFMDSVAQPYALSQRPILTEDQFLKEAKRRGLWLPLEKDLELLHRLGLLVPILRYDKPVRSLRAAARRHPGRKWEILSGGIPVHGPDLLAEASAGRVARAREGPFRSWARRRRMEGDVSFRATEYLYSPYQLLTIHHVQEALRTRRAQRARFTSREWAATVIQGVRAVSLRNDGHAALLTALEPVFYPGIIAQARMPLGYGIDFGEYDAYVRSVDAVALLATVRMTADDLLRTAERFLSDAHDIDPLRNWIELVGLVHPDKWARLEGSALLAIDLRIAAEMCLRLYEELAASGQAGPLPALSGRWWSPLHDRIGGRRDDLDSVLIDYDLSPHPALLLIVEGWTELSVVPRVMRMLSIPVRDSFIQVVDLGGADKSFEQIARLSAPRLRRSSPSVADMLRPPLRVLIVMDEDGRFSTPAKRAERKREWVEYVWNMLGEDLRTDVAQGEIEQMIEVTTWREGGGDLELAHFSARQLARAHARSGQIPSGRDVAWAELQIAQARARGMSLKKLWKTWPGPRPTKEALWKELWPSLERQIRHEARMGSPESVPICAVLLHARELASGHRRHVMMRVG